MTKQQWRSALLAARRGRSPGDREADRDAVSHALLDGLAPHAGGGTFGPAGATGAARPATGPGRMTICAYSPLPSEPLAPDLPDLLAESGLRILLPVARPGEPLDWCELGSPTRPGMLGVAEPTGARLGAAAIREAAVVLVPALAIDASGVRLGRGGGHYDRSLALLGPAGPEGARTRLIAVVFDDEVVARLPCDPHDVRIPEVVTPRGGLRHVASWAPFGAKSN